MKALKFMKIDYIKTKQQAVMMPFLLLLVVLIMMLPDSEVNRYSYGIMMPFCYMVFMSIILSTTPFGSCKREEAGFLILLPAKTRDRVLGRFLYGMAQIITAAVLGFGASIMRMALGHKGSLTGSLNSSLCLVVLAIGILTVSLEYVFFYLFGENKGQNLIGIVRTLPGMCLFFVSGHLFGEVMENPEESVRMMQTVGSHLRGIAYLSLAASLFVFAASAALCVQVVKRRDA